MNDAIYVTRFASPRRPIRTHVGRWRWSVADGMTGPTIAAGIALTEQGAYRRIEDVLRRCQNESERLRAICAELRATSGVQVEASFDERHRLCVRPLCPCTDREHRAVMAAFFPVDPAVRWEVADA